MNRERTVLLTGASGVLGRAVAEELRDHHVMGLAHQDTDLPEVDEIVSGTLEAPRLGLDARAWAALAERVEVIIHSGALTEWGQPWPRYESINIGGTGEVLALAKRANAPIHLLSTCFVHALERDGMHLVGPDNVVTPYIRSKLASEKLVIHSGVPHSIYRPTNLVGDSRTGASSTPQIVQTMSDWLCRGKAPYFPAHPGNPLDILPLDVAAIAIARAVESDDLGRLYWLTTGPTAMTLDEAMDILVAHAADLGRRMSQVDIVDPSLPLPVPLAELPATSRSFVKVLVDVSEITKACGGVLPTSLPELRDRHGVPVVSERDAYRISLKYWAEQRRASRAAARLGEWGGAVTTQDQQTGESTDTTGAVGSWLSPDLAGAVTLVTGASRGVGRGIALALGDAGATVYVTGRSTGHGPRTENLPGTIDDTAAEVTARGGRGVAVRCDHTVAAAVEALFERIERERGRLDLLVNNAWAGYERSDEARFDAAFWQQPLWRWDLFAGSLRGQFMASSLAVPLMRAGGVIVNISFTDADLYLGQTPYDVIKYASDRMVVGMAYDLRKQDIAAIALHPGFVRTERVAAAWSALGAGPAQVVHSPEYVGRAVAHLLADAQAKALSGTTVAVGDLAARYGFTDVDGKRPPAFHLEGRMTLATRMERLNRVLARAPKDNTEDS